MNLLNKSALGAAVFALITTSSAHAQLLNTNSNLETTGPLYTGSPYADQTVAGYGYNSNILGVGEPFAGYVTDADNYQIYQTSSAGATGSFAGPTVIQVNGNGNKGYTLESMAPVTTIQQGMVYTLTLAIANNGGGAGNVTLSLFTATMTPNTNDYSGLNPGGNPANGYYPAPPNPYGIYTTGAVFVSNTVSSGTINAQPLEQFTDYSVTFDTYGSDNAGAVGQPLYLGVNVDSNGSLQFDNVRLEAIPEPSAWALMLAGAAGLVLLGRRKLVS